MSNIFTEMQTTNTILGLIRQHKAQLNHAVDINKEHTLNKKYNIAYNIEPSVMLPGDVKLQYFGIGVNGTNDIDGSSTPYVPSARNMDLFKPIPIRVIPVSTIGNFDVSDYRMRELRNINGIDYYLFWLKKMSYLSEDVEVSQVTQAGVSSAYVYNDGVDDLNPDPSINSPHNLDQRVHVSIRGECVIKGEEVAEAAEYIPDIYSGELNITEVGFYSGGDVDVDGRTEALGVELNVHRCFTPIIMTDYTKVVELPMILTNGSSMMSGTYVGNN